MSTANLPLAYESWKSADDGIPKIKIVLSDLHLAAGMFWGGERNPHEDFHGDAELTELILHFCKGKYQNHHVELILNGDIFDFLNVPYQGDFPEAITEELAIWKLKKILKGHPDVTKALQSFSLTSNKTITYVIGNHDADFFFKGVQKEFATTISPNDPNLVKFISDVDYYEIDGKIQIHHGHQFEGVHLMNYSQPFLTKNLSQPILNLPWGSLYVMKIVNRLKRERDYLDKVKPVKLYLLYGLLTDTLFTLKYGLLSAFFFFRSRFIYDPRRKSSLKTTIRILKEEFKIWDDGEGYAKEVLNSQPEVQAVIMGHTHVPRYAVYGDGRVYVNTGTWIRMINLDLKGFGSTTRRPFCMIEYDGKGSRPMISLRDWKGEHSVFEHFLG